MLWTAHAPPAVKVQELCDQLDTVLSAISEISPKQHWTLIERQPEDFESRKGGRIQNMFLMYAIASYLKGKFGNDYRVGFQQPDARYRFLGTSDKQGVVEWVTAWLANDKRAKDPTSTYESGMQYARGIWQKRRSLAKQYTDLADSFVQLLPLYYANDSDALHRFKSSQQNTPESSQRHRKRSREHKLEQGAQAVAPNDNHPPVEQPSPPLETQVAQLLAQHSRTPRIAPRLTSESVGFLLAGKNTETPQNEQLAAKAYALLRQEAGKSQSLSDRVPSLKNLRAAHTMRLDMRRKPPEPTATTTTEENVQELLRDVFDLIR